MNSTSSIPLKSERKQRDSNIELLRIVSMMMIVVHHFVAHGVMNYTDSSRCFKVWEQGSAINRFLSCLAFPGGEVGVGIFFIITGYFYIKRDKADFSKIIIETSFYSILLSALSLILYFANLGGVVTKDISMSLKTAILPVSSGIYWFVTTYIFLLILTPLINPIINKANIKGHIALIIFLYFFWFVLGAFGSPYFNLQKGLLFYAIGAFLRIHDFKKAKKTGLAVIPAFIVFWGLETFIAYKMAQNGIAEPERFNEKMFFYFKTCESALSPFCSLLFFMFFLNMDLGSSKPINTIAATVFGVYLLHDSVLLRKLIWHKIFLIDTKLYFSALFPLYLLMIPFIVFCACSLIDYMRIVFISPIINHYYDMCSQKMKQWFF